MPASDVVQRLKNTSLSILPLKFCVVNEKKLPFTTQNTMARVNVDSDFVSFSEICNFKDLNCYKSLGISILASKITAIDIDHCVSIDNTNSLIITDIASDIISIFANVSYTEISFSGTGIRILFYTNNIDNYQDTYYYKNTKIHVECYQNTPRYVTITGNTLIDNISANNIDSSTFLMFLDKYMKHDSLNSLKNNMNSNVSYESLATSKQISLKKLIFTNNLFRTRWYREKNLETLSESDIDYYLLSTLYKTITHDLTKIKLCFESSVYFNTKSEKHLIKWNRNNYSYFYRTMQKIIQGG